MSSFPVAACFFLACFECLAEKAAIDLGLDCGDVSVAISVIHRRDSRASPSPRKEEFAENPGTGFGPTANRNVSTETGAEFLVDDIFHRVVIGIHGKVSKVSLEILTGEKLARNDATKSWGCKSEADGVKIDAIDAPPGEWRLKLLGEQDSKWNFDVEAFGNEGRSVEKLFPPLSRLEEGKFDEENGGENEAEKINSSQQRQLRASKNDDSVRNEKIIAGRSLKSQSDDWEINGENLDANDSLMNSSIAENVLINLVEFVTMAESEHKQTSDKEEDLETRSSIASVENPASKKKGDKLSMRSTEELSENDKEAKETSLELNRNSNLLVTPGTIHRIVFDATNNCVLPVRYAFRVSSTPFRVYNVQPQYAWIYPGQLSNVAIDLIVPDNAAPNTANTVSLSVLGTQIKEKTVYLYVQGSLSKLTDDVKPSIEYYFNNNCAGKLSKDRCHKSRWSVDVTIQDYDSGLKRVISSPNDAYPSTEFVSGTRSPVTFYYSATCCDKTAKITAIDLLDNYKTTTVDVTEWSNLSEAEIAAITVGALLALLLVAFLVLAIAYCVRRRKSLNLPYTQRYASRPPAQPERTNF